MSNGKNGFEHFENDCDKVWLYRLRSSFYKIQGEVSRNSGKHLNEPIFDINPNIKHKWASWSPDERHMVFSATLLRNFEWAAVEHVMRHEVAHMIVSEIFGIDCHGVSHGSAFERACKIVNIEPSRCESATFLSSFKGTESAPMVEKVRKIIIKANDDAATEEEAELFMRKARELMLRHDIEMQDVVGSEKVWVRRPFGPLFNRWPAYMWRLGDLLSEHYHIKHIRTYGPNGTKRLEIFGEPDKLDIAEYVGHALLNQAELLYDKYKKEVAAERAEGIRNGSYTPAPNGWGKRKISKRAFMEGLIDGYSEKLRRDLADAKRRVGEEVAQEEKGMAYEPGDCAMVPTYDRRLMEEMYGKEYPNLVTHTCSGAYGMGRGSGRAAGSKLTLARGVNRGSNSGRLLR
jgi:predicted SprT family Zn-dependent metalloprotease